MDRRATKSGQRLQVLYGEETTRPELAGDEMFLDLLIGELEEIHAIAPLLAIAFDGGAHEPRYGAARRHSRVSLRSIEPLPALW
jgi:hypothetical protein